MSVLPPHPPAASGPAIAVVGAGPTAIGCSSGWSPARPSWAAAGRLQVHLIDPHPPGGGRVWRAAQPSLLWANSLAADVTVLPDASVTVDGPVGRGHHVVAVGRGGGPAPPGGRPDRARRRGR